MAAAVTQTGAHAEAKAEGRPFGWYGMVFFLASESFFFATSSRLSLSACGAWRIYVESSITLRRQPGDAESAAASYWCGRWSGLKRGNNRRLAMASR
jgi:hypothetical protein